MAKKRYLSLVAASALCLVVGPAAAASSEPSAQASAPHTARACQYPANVLDLKNWKETLPIGSSGSPTEITQPKLATYKKDPWFVANSACDGVQFRAAVNGVTTSGSGYPRSELREMKGSDTASWSPSSGTHTMTIQEAFTHLPNDKTQVVGGQVHNTDDDVTVFRLQGTKLYVTKGNTSTYKLADGNYELGTKFTAKFVASGGKIKAYYNDKLVATIGDDSSGDYFKAGAYTQANCSNSNPCDSSNYGEVTIYGLTVTHTS